MKYICKTCNNEFEGKTSSHIYKFCSHPCYAKSLVGRKPPVFIGRVKRTGYWYIHQPSHPNSGKQGYIAEHRLVMEQSIGRLLAKQEVVHHINHDITDNRIENLKLYASHGVHTRDAHPEICESQKGLTIKSKPCVVCGSVFDYDWRTKRRTTCSDKCWRTR